MTSVQEAKQNDKECVAGEEIVFKPKALRKKLLRDDRSKTISVLPRTSRACLRDWKLAVKCVAKLVDLPYQDMILQLGHINVVSLHKITGRARFEYAIKRSFIERLVDMFTGTPRQFAMFFDLVISMFVNDGTIISSDRDKGFIYFGRYYRRADIELVIKSIGLSPHQLLRYFANYASALIATNSIVVGRQEFSTPEFVGDMDWDFDFACGATAGQFALAVVQRWIHNVSHYPPCSLVEGATGCHCPLIM